MIISVIHDCLLVLVLDAGLYEGGHLAMRTVILTGLNLRVVQVA